MTTTTHYITHSSRSAMPGNGDGPRAGQRESRPKVQIATPALDGTSLHRRTVRAKAAV